MRGFATAMAVSLALAVSPLQPGFRRARSRLSAVAIMVVEAGVAVEGLHAYSQPASRLVSRSRPLGMEGLPPLLIIEDLAEWPRTAIGVTTNPSPPWNLTTN